jgi:CPA2 family monovalent cation:H+ antiporter-2
MSKSAISPLRSRELHKQEVNWHEMTTTHGVSFLFIELGLVVVGLAVLARLARHWGFPAIPLYLLAGLAFGKGGLAPLTLTENFVRTGAEIGVLMLLFMLGLEYTGDELKNSLRRGIAAGVIDLVLNFTPGFVAGFLLGWRLLAAVLLGGVTYISSSGAVAKLLVELRRMDNPETPLVVSPCWFRKIWQWQFTFRSSLCC